MSNKEAYISDLEELEKAIDALLRAVPAGKKKQDVVIREDAERVAGAARATIGCMKRDYIPVEFD